LTTMGPSNLLRVKDPGRSEVVGIDRISYRPRDLQQRRYYRSRLYLKVLGSEGAGISPMEGCTCIRIPTPLLGSAFPSGNREGAVLGLGLVTGARTSIAVHCKCVKCCRTYQGEILVVREGTTHDPVREGKSRRRMETGALNNCAKALQLCIMG
jgi:hypothetical protein